MGSRGSRGTGVVPDNTHVTGVTWCVDVVCGRFRKLKRSKRQVSRVGFDMSRRTPTDRLLHRNLTLAAEVSISEEQSKIKWHCDMTDVPSRQLLSKDRMSDRGEVCFSNHAHGPDNQDRTSSMMSNATLMSKTWPESSWRSCG